MTPGLTAIQKFSNYVSTHSKECRGKSVYEICVSIMKMSPEEFSEIKKNRYLLPYEYIQEEENIPYKSFGVEITSSQKKQKPQKQKRNEVSIIEKKYHPQADFAEVDENNRIIPEQFSLAELKKKYPKDKYNINQEKDGAISVTKKDGTPLLNVRANTDLMSRVIYFDGVDKIRKLGYDPEGNVRFFAIEKRTLNGIMRTNYKNGSKYPTRTVVESEDGKTMTYYDKYGRLASKEVYFVEGVQPFSKTSYSNGQPYKVQNGDKVEYPLVDDLVKMLSSDFSDQKSVSEFSTMVLKRMNAANGAEIAEQYYIKTGHDILDDIKDMSIQLITKNKIISHVESIVGESLAYELYSDISLFGSGQLSEHVMKINTTNIKDVLVKYRERSFYKNKGGHVHADDINSFLAKVGMDVHESLKKGTVEAIFPCEGLLSAISKEVGLPKAERKRLIDHIINTALKNCAPSTKKRALADIKKHPDDMYKVEVDLYRAINLENGEIDDINLDFPKIPTTRVDFKGNMSQGKLQDCWLMAPVFSGKNKPEAMKKYDEQVKYDEKTDTYYVHYKGLHKVYIVPGQRLEEKTFLSFGSKKLKAIEYSYDYHKKQTAYDYKKPRFLINDGTITGVDLTGGHPLSFWQDFFGKTNDDFLVREPLTEDFNNPNHLYVLHLVPNETYPKQMDDFAMDKIGNKISISTFHSIALVGSDENNVYVVDTDSSDEELIVPREQLLRDNVYPFKKDLK